MKLKIKAGAMIFFGLALLITGWMWINGSDAEAKGVGMFYSWLVLAGLGIFILAKK